MHHLLHSAVEAVVIWSGVCWAIGGATVGTVVHKLHKRRG